jgi:hypothetical protein
MRFSRTACVIMTFMMAGTTGTATARKVDAHDWVAESNQHTQMVLDAQARFNPEGAAALGVDGLDEEIVDLKPQLYERTMAVAGEVLADLRKRLDQTTHPLVRQDIEILIKSTEDLMRTSKLQQEALLPYFNVGQIIFGGTRALLDPQVPKERYPAIVVRLRKYTGLEPGFVPITQLARERISERFDVPGLLGPYRGQIETDLKDSDTYIAGIEELLKGADVKGWQKPYKVLAQQLREYNEWLRKEMLPRARDDFRLPPALYEDALRNYGVYASPEELIQAATQGYADIRNEMIALAPLVAKEKGYDTTDYHEVLRRLREDQAPGDQLLPEYRGVLNQIEDVIEKNGLVTLPEREAGIRIGSAAETAAQPAAHLDIPRLIGNTGEFPNFVLPQLEKNPDGSWKPTDDAARAGMWTLTAHEARPGHELQFSSMVETGVSMARAIFAFNSANVEGWALYAEAITKPYMPLDAQLASLQSRLVRAARMFLDPMLNLGRIEPEQAKRLLLEDVVIDDRWATTEVERYTFRIPGQATAYYYGYRNLQALRTQTELALRDRFDQKAFHDFVLSQGLLPPELLKKAVMEEFVPAALRHQ